MINYLIRLVEGILLRIRDNNVDLEVAEDHSTSIIEEFDNSSSSSLIRNSGNKSNSLYDTSELHDSIPSSKFHELMPQNNHTYVTDIEHLNYKNDKNGSNLLSSIHAYAEDSSSKRNITDSRNNKIPVGYASMNNMEEIKQKTNDLQEKLEHTQKINSIPDDLASSGSVEIPVEYITGPSQPKHLAFATAEKENKRKRKGKNHTPRRKDNYSKTSKHNNNMSFSDLLSQAPSNSRIATLRPIRVINAPFTKIYHNAKSNLPNNKRSQSESQYLADRAETIRKNAMHFHKELQETLGNYEERKPAQKEPLTIPPRLRGLLERLRVSLLAEKIRYLQNQQHENVYKVYEKPNKYTTSKYDILTDKIAGIKQQTKDSFKTGHEYRKDRFAKIKSILKDTEYSQIYSLPHHSVGMKPDTNNVPKQNKLSGKF